MFPISEALPSKVQVKPILQREDPAVVRAARHDKGEKSRKKRQVQLVRR